MPDCERYQQLLSRRLDEPLAPDDNAAVDNHLRDCPACRKFAAELGRQRELLSKLPELTADRLVNPRESTPTGRSVAQRFWRMRLSVPVPLAAALLAAVVGWGLIDSIGHNGSERKTVPGEREVRVIHLDPVSAVRIGQ